MVITEQLLNNELSKLKVQGYNPISGLYDTPDESSRQRHSICTRYNVMFAMAR